MVHWLRGLRILYGMPKVSLFSFSMPTIPWDPAKYALATLDLTQYGHGVLGHRIVWIRYLEISSSMTTVPWNLANHNTEAMSSRAVRLWGPRFSYVQCN